MVVNMTKRFSWLNCLIAAALIAQTLIGPVQAAPTVTRTDDSPIQQTLKSTATVSAIIELDGAPLVERSRTQVSMMMQRDRRIDFDSAEAVALDTQVRGEQENFKARARLIAPTLRVRTEVRALANAVSVEARGTEIAALAALPG